MKAIVIALLTVTAALGQDVKTPSEGAIYNPVGQLIGYQYADRTRESYTYDEQGRMKTFTDRAGYVTMFIYGSDGSMTTIKPDGSTGR